MFDGLLHTSITIGILIVGVFIAVVFGGIPGNAAKRRGHPSWEAVRLCGYIGLFFWPLWIIALIWAYASKGDGQAAVVGAAAAPRPGEKYRQQAMNSPGRFRIAGVDRESSLETTIVVEASNAATARVKAELKGIVITEVTPLDV